MRAMVPVSVRAEEEHGALGNRISAMMAPLPVGCEDPVERLRLVTETMGDLKGSGQAVGAEILTQITDFAPPTIASQAARLQPAQRFFNLVVTNVPGPQFPLYVLGRKMESIFPMVPLARRQALCVGIMSYDGEVDFGLVGDYDAMADLDSFGARPRGRDRGDRRDASGRQRANGSAHDPGPGPERRRVGQVVPVELAGAEADRRRVGVDQDRRDPAEAARVGAAAPTSCPPLRLKLSRETTLAVPFAAEPADQGDRRRVPGGAARLTTTARPPWAGTRSISKVVWLSVRWVSPPPQRRGSPGAGRPGRGSLRGRRCRCATRRRRGEKRAKSRSKSEPPAARIARS